ncbi:MAG: 16S rRNA (cytosine(967)-C(5))-methyltransferase RsmB [Pseudomonadales bacterium]|nr:16S rRNA (cytosine(967)-C(5))-methyltransferase RsmB [Pseudomonadales bacterium]MCP5189246.1 16S rRNA (cytosine(967)-C(5))-methyltransferase RsmB [Pseudomonadales bacterium]
MALDARVAAARVIGEVIAGKSLNQALPEHLQQVSPRDRGLLQQLCYGTLRQQPKLHGVLQQLLARPLRDRDSDIQGLLLCGLYQLEGMRIPDHAAVAATVGATRALHKPWAKGMVNAVLRRFLRERVALLANLDRAAAACHPAWLLEAIHCQWPEYADSIVAANNLQPPMTLRVNGRRGERQDYLRRLQAAGLGAVAGDLSPWSIRLAHPCDVAELPGFVEGEVSVQDEAAQLAAPLLQARPGDRVLDACAAPGGKSCHLLELCPDLGELVVADVDAARLGRVEENLLRLGLCATVLEADARRPPATLAPASFDRILVDAPCSATGVIRRHPDIKLLRRPGDIPALAAQQGQILQGLWPLLKPGGLLLYVTCSLLKEENDQVVSRFTGDSDDAAAMPLTVSWGEPAGCGRQLLPEAGGPDGLFFTLLQKRA